MSRTKKDAKILNIKLDREIHEQLEQFCDESGLTKTVAVEKILQRYFEEYFKRPKEDRTLF
jgi:antitoxin component of RelBE/YafQ-DinJ toxin-antitoxin module